MQNENSIKKELKPLGIQWDLETKKEVAKIGMSTSMAVVVGTSFVMDSKAMRNLHIGAGVALVGFSLWHHLLYQPAKKESSKKHKDISSSQTQQPALNFQEVYASMRIEGVLTHEEVEAFEERLEALLASYAKPSTQLLVDVRGLEKIEAGVIWHDMLQGFGKHPEISKVAIVGESKLEKLSISLTRVFIVKPKIGYFETLEGAKEWLLES